jgi:hypothetical protein
LVVSNDLSMWIEAISVVASSYIERVSVDVHMV